MGPKGFEMLTPGESDEMLDIDVLTEQLKIERT
jgi:hypothetical protein